MSSTGINDDSSRLHNSEVTENGEIDYKKLYEESQVQNERLREKLKKTEDELTDARSNLEKHVNMDKSSLSELEKRERRALERKLSEMEEELKVNFIGEKLLKYAFLEIALTAKFVIDGL